MRQPLRRGAARLRAAAAARLRRLGRPRAAPVKGSMRSVIVVPSPDPRFREVLFILREDWPGGEELNRQELLLQAREAARAYTASALPSRRRRFSAPLLMLLTAAAVLAAEYFLGLF